MRYEAFSDLCVAEIMNRWPATIAVFIDFNMLASSSDPARAGFSHLRLGAECIRATAVKPSRGQAFRTAD